jgi:predicted small secreted protein
MEAMVALRDKKGTNMTILRRPTGALSLASLLVVALLTLGACYTVEGAGKDIEAGGEAMQEGSQDVRRRM